MSSNKRLTKDDKEEIRYFVNEHEFELEKSTKNRNPYRYYKCCHTFCSKKAPAGKTHVSDSSMTYFQFKKAYPLPGQDEFNLFNVLCFLSQSHKGVKRKDYLPTINARHKSPEFLPSSSEVSEKENTQQEDIDQSCNMLGKRRKPDSPSKPQDGKSALTVSGMIKEAKGSLLIAKKKLNTALLALDLISTAHAKSNIARKSASKSSSSSSSSGDN